MKRGKENEGKEKYLKVRESCNTEDKMEQVIVNVCLFGGICQNFIYALNKEFLLPKIQFRKDIHFPCPDLHKQTEFLTYWYHSNTLLQCCWLQPSTGMLTNMVKPAAFSLLCGQIQFAWGCDFLKIYLCRHTPHLFTGTINP